MAATLDHSVRRIRRRALALLAARAVSLSIAACLCTLSVAVLVVGPGLSATGALLTWCLTAFGALASILLCVRAALRLRGAGIAHVLQGTRPDLVSATKSALELRSAPRQTRFAVGLVRAHATEVARLIAAVAPHHAVPWTRTHTWIVASPIVVATAMAVTGLATDRWTLGWYGLFHPATVASSGEIMAPAVTTLEVEARFPAHWNRPTVTLHSPAVVEVPPGTVLRLRATTAMEATGGSIQVGPTRATLAVDHGVLTGELLADRGGEIVLRIATDMGVVVRDATHRELRVVSDQRPLVTMEEPSDDVSMERDEVLTIRWQAQDDVALGQVDLVVHAGGRVFRQRLSNEHGPSRGASAPTAAGTTRIVPATFGARPGDTLTVVVEAFDRNLLSGPGIGRSAARNVRVTGQGTPTDRDRVGLAAALEAAIASLALRLGWSPPVDPSVGVARPGVDGLVRTLLALQSSESGSLGRGMADQLRRKDALERASYRPPAATLARRTAHHLALRDELEAQVLALSDWLGQVDLAAASALIAELDQVRQEIASLARELARSATQESRERVLAAIARAETKLSEVMARIALLQTGAPSDFLNASALTEAPTEDALSALRAAIEAGDTTSAERHLLALQSQIDAMARALSQGGEGFGGGQMGPRERALAEALAELTEIEAEQRVLLDRTLDRRQRATQQALGNGRDRATLGRRPMTEAAERLREALARLEGENLGTRDTESLDRARARVRDVADALEAGELGQARRMTQEASGDIDALGRGLELSEWIDGDPAGAPPPSMQQAERAVAQLLDEIDRSIPNLDRMLDSGQRSQMRSDSDLQNAARARTDCLEQRLGQSPDNWPLVQSPDAALQPVRRAMERATSALEGGRLVEAGSTQHEATRGLAALRQALEREQAESMASSSSSQGGSQNGHDAWRDSLERVDIPAAEAFHGPEQARRRLLDAMRDPVSPAHQAAVDRYFEGLLR